VRGAKTGAETLGGIRAMLTDKAFIDEFHVLEENLTVAPI